MIYQLANGKVLYLTLEEYLGLSDLELHELSNSDIGSDPSYIYTKLKSKEATEDIEDTVDYDKDTDEIVCTKHIRLDTLLENTIEYFEIEIEIIEDNTED